MTLTPLYSWAAPAPPTSTLKIMIDPGHGGSDRGAARGSLKESEIALKVSLRLAERLRQEPRYKVSMTRTTDQSLSLAKRTQIAQEEKADLFISIHLNSSADPRAHGMEIYFQNQLPADEDALLQLSRENEEIRETTTSSREAMSPQADLKRILEDLNRNHRIQASSELGKSLFDSLLENGSGERLGSRVLRQAPFHVVSMTQIPAVLVEIGFLTHPQEGPRLADPAYQEQLVNILAQGINRYVARESKAALEVSTEVAADGPSSSSTKP